ncbi:PolB1-binding protein PBP2 family protein [Stetteria hydrogenophila]
MAEEWLIEASRLLEKARRLSRDEKAVFNYFMDNVSVGTIRAVKELKYKGVSDPMKIIMKLVDEGLLEKGYDCFNLPKPLRVYRTRRGPVKV